MDATPPTFNKSTWGDGPWQTEPDRVEWRHAGLPCLVQRNHHGAWCGYAAVSPGHPWHGRKRDDIDVDVHGDLTYEGACSGHICHVPAPGEPDDVWWFGFDCGHAWDQSPGMDALLRSLEEQHPELRPEWRRVPLPDIPPEWLPRETYKPLAYVQAETERLAEQLAAATP